MTTLAGIVGAIFLFGIVIFIHELGHFIIAKALGIDVVRFSLGFGPIIFSFKRGTTEYALSAIPLGGYVMFVDDLQSEKTQGLTSFEESPWYSKLAVSSMGTIFNLALGLILFTALFLFVGKQMYLPVVGEVRKGSPAEMAGIMPGDYVLKVDGREVKFWDDIAELINASNGNPVNIQVRRNGRIIEFIVKPELYYESAGEGKEVKRWIIGIMYNPKAVVYVKQSPLKALKLGVSKFIYAVTFMVQGVKKLFSKVENLKEVSGPVGIGKVAYNAAREGTYVYFFMLGIISIAVGVFNFLPIPPLDGFGVLIYLFEGIFRRKPTRMVKIAIQAVGLALLLGLMIFTIFNDIARIVRGEF